MRREASHLHHDLTLVLRLLENAGRAGLRRNEKGVIIGITHFVKALAGAVGAVPSRLRWTPLG